ncbi:Ark- serine/threonine protein kinase [Coemansia spiralis]|uniref:non-specific serine/threonine protein kinase n=2 Tax=Coemansia TaxID=4863 RepID=A0A9W8G9A4_9FUNG|nr:Ark- serine/threonine protein kinase [Coemansia umbellata]KAJ2624937.1 Ark- serine/threonine protein kinase [Coemansia sp. RSA 1358]KAJ2679155.1 Ark- serine/threonine protein kinase [Coemansia spiralis]
MPSEFDDIGSPLPKINGLFSQGTIIQVSNHACIVQRFLSSGGHANIYFVTLVSDGSPHVLKHIFFGEDPTSPARQCAEQEIPIMSQLNGHPNIVSLTAAELADDCAYILMEFCPGDVLSLMNANLSPGLDEPTILHIFCDVCKAVAHMHYQDPPLLHRDLKVENVLIAPSSYKLCDFGSATSKTIAQGTRMSREETLSLEDEIQRCTTLEYRAPEMVDLYLRRGVNEKADIWALGVLLYKLCYFKTPFDNASSLAILNAEYSLPASPVYSKELRHIFQMTLREEPRERPTIYTLTTYVCALRREPCQLENKYASPPSSPNDVQHHQRDGLGYVAGTPPVPPPRRYAASNNKYALSSNSSQTDLSASDGISELDSSAIVPMRRGRPTRQQPASATSSVANFGSKHPTNNHNKFGVSSAALPATNNASPSNSSNNDRGTYQPQQQPKDSNEAARSALGIYSPRDSSEAAAAEEEPVQSPSGLRHMRMSVKAPDGRESMSVDFVQGAVFGSARRTSSMLRRNPSAASNTSSHRSSHAGSGGNSSNVFDNLDDNASRLARKSTGSLRLMRSHSRSSTALEVAMDAPISPLPGFVSQPLPPPPPVPQKAQGARRKQMAGVDVNVDASADTTMANMISPLSLQDSQSPNGLAVDNAVFQNEESSVKLQNVKEWMAASQESSTPNEEPLLSRLSTIMESHQDEPNGQANTAMPVSRYNQSQERAPVKSIYAMTMDKLEDDARFSMLFDDPTIFDAKARFAAQRSSVYQTPDSGYNGTSHATADAQENWSSISFDMMDSMMRKMSDQAKAAEPAKNNGNDEDAWSVKPRRRNISPTNINEDGEELDIDSVLHRAEQRNRKKLIAQNNRRSQYIFSVYGAQSSGASAMLSADPHVPVPPVQDTQGILKEDVEDGMRVLSEEEIEALLKKMDMYNRELLSEQEKWHNRSAQDSSIDLQSLDQMIAQANDQLLRKEQAAKAVEECTVAQKTNSGTGLLQNVISAAKSTFVKTTLATPAAADSEQLVASASSPVHATVAEIEKPKPQDAVIAEVENPANLPTASVDVSAPTNPPRTPSQTETVQQPSNSSLPKATSRTPESTDSAVASKPTVPLSPSPPALAPDASTTQENGEPLTRKTSNSAASPKQPTHATASLSESPSKTSSVATALTANPQPSTLDNGGGSSKALEAPRMQRTQTDTPSTATIDPLTEVRARLKKKQSSPTLPTTTRSLTGGSVAARTVFLGSGESKAGSQPNTPPGSVKATSKKPTKSVKNLVAMFEQS